MVVAGYSLRPLHTQDSRPVTVAIEDLEIVQLHVTCDCEGLAKGLKRLPWMMKSPRGKLQMMFHGLPEVVKKKSSSLQIPFQMLVALI